MESDKSGLGNSFLVIITSVSGNRRLGLERWSRAQLRLLRTCTDTYIATDISTVQTKPPEFRNCVKEEVDVLGSPALIIYTAFVDVKQH